MYGYVRPVRDELKLREYDTFRGVYCGLCHTLRRRYGFPWRFAVNYDLTFLAMLLAEGDAPRLCPRRCPYHPLRLRTMCPEGSASLDAAADLTVILAYWKMRDEARDRGPVPALGCRVLAALMRPAYRRAAALRPAFAALTEERLAALASLERERCASIDRPADAFAQILAAAAEGAAAPERVRVLRELLYHLGRIVYLLDAADDLADDIRADAYNPLRFRFSPENGRLTAADEAALRLSLQHSHNSVISAFALLDGGPYADILKNILYLGLPAVTQAVFSGTWRARRGDFPDTNEGEEI